MSWCSMSKLSTIALLALLVSCGGGNEEPGSKVPSATTSTAEQSSAIAEDGRYGQVETLRDAAVEAGYACAHWRKTNVVELAAESGNCSREDVFSTYVSDSDLQKQLSLSKDLDGMLADAGIKPTPRLVGENWIIDGPEAPTLQGELGGTVVQSDMK